MSRYLVPALFLGTTAWAGWYNATHRTSKITLPLLDLIVPVAEEDPELVGARTVQALAILTASAFVIAFVGHVRSLRQREG